MNLGHGCPCVEVCLARERLSDVAHLFVHTVRLYNTIMKLKTICVIRDLLNSFVTGGGKILPLGLYLINQQVVKLEEQNILRDISTKLDKPKHADILLLISGSKTQ